MERLYIKLPFLCVHIKFFPGIAINSYYCSRVAFRPHKNLVFGERHEDNNWINQSYKSILYKFIGI